MADTTTLLGTSWCGFTTKQKKYFEKNDIPYQDVDCTNVKCTINGQDVTGYPALCKNGKHTKDDKHVHFECEEKSVGYTEKIPWMGS